jgi:hypothetical protein
VAQPLQRRKLNTAVRPGPASTFLPVEVSDQQFAHGLIRTDGYLPPSAPIDHGWLSAAAHLYGYGTGLTSRFVPRLGIDGERALRHLGALLRTPQLESGRRDNAVALLLRAWFTSVALEAGPVAGALA